MIPEIIDFPLTLKDRKMRVLHALDVLLGQDLTENRLASMQRSLNAMAQEMNHLHDRLNEQTKRLRAIHQIAEEDQ